MKTDYFAIIGDYNGEQSHIIVDEVQNYLHIKLLPDFERYTKLSWLEKWILLRVFTRLTPASQDKE